jgi:hypothetical protein
MKHNQVALTGTVSVCAGGRMLHRTSSANRSTAACMPPETIMSLDLNPLPILFAIYKTKSVGEAVLKLGMSRIVGIEN